MDKTLLMNIMRWRGDTQKDLALFLLLSRSRLNAKLNQRSGAEFTQGEIRAMIFRYQLDPDTVMRIFFCPKVS